MSAKKRKKKKSSPLRIVLGCFLILLLSVVLLVFLFLESKLSLIDYDDGSEDAALLRGEISIPEGENGDGFDFGDGIELDLSGLEEVLELKLPEGAVKEDRDVLNILLLGTDERTVDFNYASRADAIMLISLNFEEHTGKLVSFERGMGVLILDGEHQGKYDWLTHCFRYGGASLMLREIQEHFLVDVDHYIRINFSALIKLVDAVGGVDVELTSAEANYINSGNGNSYRGDSNDNWQVVHEGMNHLNGVSALMYARCRHIDSDWRRIVRQRNLVQAFVNQIKSSDLATLNNLVDTLLPMIRTNFTQAEILSLLPKAPGMIGLTFDQMTIPVEGSYGSMPIMNDNFGFAPDLEYNAKVLDEFLYGKSEN